MADAKGNGNAVFETAEEFREAAERYFGERDARNALYSLSGLCLALSKYNRKRKTVSVDTLSSWFRGERCSYLQEDVQLACLRIQEQIETDPRYQEKGGMSTKAIFLLKQPMLGGYQDQQRESGETRVQINFGGNMNASDFK